MPKISAKPIEFRIYRSSSTWYTKAGKPQQWFTWEMWRGRTFICEGHKGYRTEKACIKFVQELGESFQDTGFIIAETRSA
jgi:hypothetical protein